MIQIYGSPQSSAGRCFVMLEECGVPYTRMPLNMKEREHKSPVYLKLNPNGKVPCLVEGDFLLWESAAIVKYLAEKHRPELCGTTPETRALIDQWSFWTMTEVQPPLVDILIQKIFIPEERRDLALIARREKQLPGILTVLENELVGKKFLVNEQYSIADLMVASGVKLVTDLQLKVGDYPNVTTWLQTVLTRPAWIKVSKMTSEH